MYLAVANLFFSRDRKAYICVSCLVTFAQRNPMIRADVGALFVDPSSERDNENRSHPHKRRNKIMMESENEKRKQKKKAKAVHVAGSVHLNGSWRINGWLCLQCTSFGYNKGDVMAFVEDKLAFIQMGVRCTSSPASWRKLSIGSSQLCTSLHCFVVISLAKPSSI